VVNNDDDNDDDDYYYFSVSHVKKVGGEYEIVNHKIYFWNILNINLGIYFARN
jgi:hypothetical protein